MPEPWYLDEIADYVEDNLEDGACVALAMGALLGDPDSYQLHVGQPIGALRSRVHAAMLESSAMRRAVRGSDGLFERYIRDGNWTVCWGSKEEHRTRSEGRSPEYDVCISFSGADRDIATAIAEEIKEGHSRKVFLDDYERTKLWGEDLTEFLFDVYYRRSALCVILFSASYRRRIWTRHELRAAQTRLIDSKGRYVLPVVLDDGAVPDLFRTISWWPYRPGDAGAIAEAVDQKIDEFWGANLIPIEDAAKLFSIERVAAAVVHGFEKGARQREGPLSEAMWALSIVAAADTTTLQPDVRALVDLVIFQDGAVARLFDDEGSMDLFDDARVVRFLGPEGPLGYDEEGWGEHMHECLSPFQEYLDSLDDDDPDDPDDPDD